MKRELCIALAKLALSECCRVYYYDAGFGILVRSLDARLRDGASPTRLCCVSSPQCLRSPLFLAL